MAKKKKLKKVWKGFEWLNDIKNHNFSKDCTPILSKEEAEILANDLAEIVAKEYEENNNITKDKIKNIILTYGLHRNKKI